MRLTKSTALQFCEDVWSWLAVNPEKDKSDYPGWEANGGSVPKMTYDCPCCEYAVTASGRKRLEAECSGVRENTECGRCPLAKFWPSGGCLTLSSPFIIWDGANPRSRFGRIIRTGCATMIALAAKQERERLERKAGRRKSKEA